MFLSNLMAEPQHKAFRTPVGDDAANVKPTFNRGGVIETTILAEDFSKFTAGNDSEPDNMRLDNAETGVISDAYFNAPGWKGNEIYQGGGCAYIGFSEKYQEPGILITPRINTSGAIYINCRVRTIDPAGDVIGYNIIGEDMEHYDANVDFFRATSEWTEISWFTSAGAENSYIYIFAYSKNIFIDDIEIVSIQLPTPTLQEETNIGSDNFTANWDAVEDADSYIFRLTAEHTAEAEETFYYTNTSFDNVVSTGTLNDPEILNEMEATIENWFIYMPALLNEAIGFTGKYASNEAYGSISSPVFDLSSNNGKINLTFKAHADLNENLIVSLITSEYGYYDVADQSVIVVEKEGWNEYSVEFSNGTNDAYVEITCFGFGNVFFDDIKLSQTIKDGETKNLVIEELEVNDTHYKANVKDTFLNDILSYQVAARKNVYSASNKIIGTIDSKFTDAKTVTFSAEEAPTDETISIGEGEIKTYYAPVSNYGSSAKFSISQQLYTKDEIQKEDGAIKSISFRNMNGYSNTRNITVFMSNTVQNSYRDTHDWIEINESQIVFSGEFTFGTQDEWSTIELQKPFVYNGKNIAISIYDNSENSLGFSNYDTFYAHATDTLRGLYKASSEKINIYNIADELYCYELKTSIYVTPANQYYVNDIQLTFGDVTIELPNTPQNLSANANSETSISLSWTSAKNATSYNVYRGTEKLANVTATSYSVEGLTTDTEYCFSITALNDNGESDKSAEACAKTLKEVQAPANLQAWAPDFEAGVISLKWDIAAGASSYSIYRDNEFLINVTENTYKDTAINDLNRTYCYTVISVSANGIESDKSNEACAQPLACIGLNELASSLNVYPNPVKDKLYIETEVKIENVAIYTITGIMVGQQTTDNGQQTLTIDLSELNSGIYFVKISTDNGEIVKRIVKRI